MVTTPRLEVVGKPWRSGARGPDAFDCWGLVHWLYRELLGVHLTPYEDVNPQDVAGVVAACRAEIKRWRKVPRHEVLDLDVVTMARNRCPHHVGIWYAPERVVLHCAENSSVVAQPLQSLRSVFRDITFYRLTQ